MGLAIYRLKVVRLIIYFIQCHHKVLKQVVYMAEIVIGMDEGKRHSILFYIVTEQG